MGFSQTPPKQGSKTRQQTKEHQRHTRRLRSTVRIVTQKRTSHTSFFVILTASTAPGTAYGPHAILKSAPPPSDGDDTRKLFMSGTPTKRNALFGKKDGPPRKVTALIVVTPSSNCHTAYLPRSADASGFKVAYNATKSNNPGNVKVVALSEDALHDCVVILPGDARPNTEDITDLGVKGYKIFDV